MLSAHREPSCSPDPRAQTGAAILVFCVQAPCVLSGLGGPKTVFQHGDKGQPTRNKADRHALVVGGLHGERVHHVLQDKSGPVHRVDVDFVVCGAHGIHSEDTLAKDLSALWGGRASIPKKRLCVPLAGLACGFFLLSLLISYFHFPISVFSVAGCPSTVKPRSVLALPPPDRGPSKPSAHVTPTNLAAM